MSHYSIKWIVQRLTGVLLIPLTFWFIYNCVLFSKTDYNQIIYFFSSYLNSLLFLVMMVLMLIHAKLGCETIIEDYVTSSVLKIVTIYLIKIVFYLAIIISLISIFNILNI